MLGGNCMVGCQKSILRGEQQMQRPLRWRVLVNMTKAKYDWSGASMEETSWGDSGVWGRVCVGGTVHKGC